MQKIKSNNELLTLNKAGRSLHIKPKLRVYNSIDLVLLVVVTVLLSVVGYMSGIELMNYDTVTFINH